MSQITTHILDLSIGKPAAGIAVTLEQTQPDDQWRRIAHGTTDADGRIRDLVPVQHQLQPGHYRLTFQTAAYFSLRYIQSFYPHVQIDIIVTDAKAHYHVPLLLSPFGYSTYRGT